MLPAENALNADMALPTDHADQTLNHERQDCMGQPYGGDDRPPCG